MENSQFENARTYLTENPDGNVRPIDSYLKSNNKTIRFGKNKFEGGYTGNIVYNSETGDQTLLDFEKTGSGAGQKKLSATDSKNIAKKLASFGFKCSAAEGGACDNPMNYLDDIKKQQVIATGSGNAAANAAKKLSAGRAIFREVLGPAALGFELAAAVPITYLGYKAGLPPARIISNTTYGLFGDTETARLKKDSS